MTAPKTFDESLGDAVAVVLDEQAAELAKWRTHAAAWEAVARNLAQITATIPEHADLFRSQCATEGLIP